MSAPVIVSNLYSLGLESIRGISKEISDVCEKYGKDKGYDAILDARATLYTPESLDITDEILKELNK